MGIFMGELFVKTRSGISSDLEKIRESLVQMKNYPSSSLIGSISQLVSFGLSPFPVIVTTRIITFLVGNPYKPSFPLLLGGGTTQGIMHSKINLGEHQMPQFLKSSGGNYRPPGVVFYTPELFGKPHWFPLAGRLREP